MSIILTVLTVILTIFTSVKIGVKAVKYNNLREFLDKLESEGKDDWQIRLN